MSLGRAAVHALPDKLDQAAKQGFEGIELYFEDLEYFARDTYNAQNPSNEQLSLAAQQIRTLCADRNLAILNLQPFMQYGGLLDRTQHAVRIEELHLWMRLASDLGTNLVQVPSSFLPVAQLDSSRDALVADLQEMADLGLAHNPPMRFAYEALAWGTQVDTWEAAWEVVRQVDRSNFGLCLDTYNLAARVYADPTRVSGRTHDADKAMDASLARLRAAFKTDADREKLFFVQLVDGERLRAPLVEGHAFYELDQPARMSWSRNCRLFYGEEEHGAYLPVKAIAEAIWDGIGYDGWWSMELFNRCMWDEDPSMPEQLAKRGIASWDRLRTDMSSRKGPLDGGNVGMKRVDSKAELQLSVHEVSNI